MLWKAVALFIFVSFSASTATLSWAQDCAMLVSAHESDPVKRTADTYIQLIESTSLIDLGEVVDALLASEDPFHLEGSFSSELLVLKSSLLKLKEIIAQVPAIDFRRATREIRKRLRELHRRISRQLHQSLEAQEEERSVSTAVTQVQRKRHPHLAVFSESGDRLVLCEKLGNLKMVLRVVYPQSGKVGRTLRLNKKFAVTAIQFFDQDRYLLVAGNHHESAARWREEILVYQVDGWRKVGQLGFEWIPLRKSVSSLAVAVHPQFNLFYVRNESRSGEDKKVQHYRVFRFSGGQFELVSDTSGSEGVIYDKLFVSPDGSDLIALNREGVVHLIPLDARGVLLKESDGSASTYRPLVDLNRNLFQPGMWMDVSFDPGVPDEFWITFGGAFVSNQSYVRVNSRSGELLEGFDRERRSVFGKPLFSRNLILLASDNNREIQIAPLRGQSSSVAYSTLKMQERIRQVVVSPDERWVYVSVADGDVYIFDTRSW